MRIDNISRVAGDVSYDQPTYLQAQNGGQQTIANNVTAVLTGWTNLVTQNAGEWNATTGVFTATKAGTYNVTSTVLLASIAWTANAYTSLLLQKNGANTVYTYYFAPSTGTYYQSNMVASGIFSLAIGDTLRVGVYNLSGVSVSLYAASNWVSIQELPARFLR